MTPGEAREELESAIWQTDPASLGAVRAVLAAADTYALAVTEEHDHRAASLIASHRQDLIVAGYGRHHRGTP
jgi:hypothetical protein